MIFKLKSAISISISLAYSLGTLGAAIALMIAIKKLKKGKQESEVSHHNISH